MDFQEIRKEYEAKGLHEGDLDPDPIANLRGWMRLAIDHSPGRWFESNAMTLATTDLHGNVTARIVLLKDILDDGVIFYTNYHSVKGRQMEANARVAVVVHWPYLGRQIRIEGTVEKTDEETSLKYFHSRPRGSQIGAYISSQSVPVDSREKLESAAAEADKQFADQPIPLPPNWGGYFLRPDKFEFWQGRLNRLHDRFQFSRINKNAWEIVRLSP